MPILPNVFGRLLTFADCRLNFVLLINTILCYLASCFLCFLSVATFLCKAWHAVLIWYSRPNVMYSYFILYNDLHVWFYINLMWHVSLVQLGWWCCKEGLELKPNYNKTFFLNWVSECVSLMSHSTHNRTFQEWVFPAKSLGYGTDKADLQHLR